MQRLTLVPRSLSTLALLGLLAACNPGSKEIGATIADSETAEASGSATDGMTSTSGESESASGGSTSPSTGEPPTTSGDSTAAEGTTGGVLSCNEASSASECATAGIADEECGWFEVTTWVASDGMCTDVEIPSGHCFTTGQGDETCGLFFDSTCPDGVTTVWYDAVGLEIGAVEIFVDELGQTCSGPSSAFMPCSFDGVNYDPPECACGCPAA